MYISVKYLFRVRDMQENIDYYEIMNNLSKNNFKNEFNDENNKRYVEFIDSNNGQYYLGVMEEKLEDGNTKFTIYERPCDEIDKGGQGGVYEMTLMKSYIKKNNQYSEINVDQNKQFVIKLCQKKKDTQKWAFHQNIKKENRQLRKLKKFGIKVPETDDSVFMSKDGKSAFYMMEKGPRDLFDRIYYNNKPLNGKEKIKLTSNLIEILEKLNKDAKRVHRDLKPENLLYNNDNNTLTSIDPNFIIKVAKTEDEEKPSTMDGTPQYVNLYVYHEDKKRKSFIKQDEFSTIMMYLEINYDIKPDFKQYENECKWSYLDIKTKKNIYAVTYNYNDKQLTAEQSKNNTDKEKLIYSILTMPEANYEYFIAHIKYYIEDCQQYKKILQ